MIPIKIFLQGAALLTSVGTCCALTSYGVSSLTSNTLFEYFLVDATPETANASTGNLFTNKEKNYKCEINEKTLDNECEIFKLSSDPLINGAVNKSIDIPSLFNKESLLKGEIKAEIYVLKITKKYIDTEGFKKPILLKSLGKDSKSFASLAKNQHLKSADKEIKSNFATVKHVVAGAQGTSYFTYDEKYYCAFGKEKNIPCKITAFQQIPNFYTFEKETINANGGTTALHQYFLLEIVDKDKEKTASQFKQGTIRVVRDNNLSSILATFHFEQLVLKDKKTSTPKKFFPILESKTWLVTSTAASASKVTNPLTNSSAIWEKNYACKLSYWGKELDCDLHELNYADSRNSSSFTNTKYWQKEITAKSELTANKFFKLSINSEKSPNIKLDGSEKIQVINKNTKGVYATLTPKFELKLNQIYGNTNLVIGKFPTALTGSAATTFKCKLSGKAGFLPCDIYKFTGSENALSGLSFSGTQKVNTESEIAPTKYFVLDLKNQQINSAINATNNQVVQITVQTDPEKTAIFNVENPLIGVINLANSNKIIYPY